MTNHNKKTTLPPERESESDDPTLKEMLEMGYTRPDLLEGDELESAIIRLSKDERLLVAIEEFVNNKVDYLGCLRRSRTGPPYVPPEISSGQYHHLIIEIGKRIENQSIIITDEMRKKFS